MPYENLYQQHALDDTLHYAISLREAALLIALDNDDRDQSEIEAEMPNGGDYVVGMSPLLEPSGKLRTARDHIEKSILRAIESRRIDFALCARTQDDKIDAVYSLVSGSDVESWCNEHDMRYGEWWMRWQEDENEFLVAIADDVVARRMPAPLERAPSPGDEEIMAQFLNSEEDQRKWMFKKLQDELHEAKQKSKSPTVEHETLGTRERNTLLTIIAALIDELGDRLPSGTYKRAQAVAAITHRIGASLADNTVDSVLKKAAATIDRRPRDSA
ncbi:hypothetical protein [Paraburkholderia acidisoli]|uniref:Uncharacterized protein n=1 Tax=Paraburkholderia acidisoli TaxID=2571748 RepID=A0A7Z2GHW6_9BURK|nr:hypothetical protein [Paraburkholderia acidisoli]QGZ62112.1 hypothetical protein FAZ98_10435 [Paraburkholderia acidisoli]